MNVISRRMLKMASEKHGDLEAPLDSWYRIAKKSTWTSLTDIRRTFSSADAVGKYTIFNIKGNAYRLVTEINYRTKRIFVRQVLTHPEYDRGKWKL